MNLDLEQELNFELEKAKRFFEQEKKNDKCFYKLYDARYADSTYDRNDLRASNFETQSLPEAMERLKLDLIRLGERSKAFWILKHYTAKNDPQPITLHLKNVYYNPQNHKGTANMINGIGSTQNIIDILRQHHEETSSLRMEILQMQHKQELKDLESRIEGLESEKRGVMDSINDFLTTPFGEQLGALLTMMVTTKMGQGAQPQIQQEQPVIRQQQQQKQEKEKNPKAAQDNSNLDQQNQVAQVQQALSKLHKAFGGDAINALSEIATFCENNPAMAQNLLRNRKGQTEPPSSSDDDDNDDY